MSANFELAFEVEQTPEHVFTAITNVRWWWSGEIQGRTDVLDGEFTYRVDNIHYSKQKIIELVPFAKISWLVVDAYHKNLKNSTEWQGTTISFAIAQEGALTNIRFTHVGLVPALECYDGCSWAWSVLIKENLRELITTGKVPPSPFAQAQHS